MQEGLADTEKANQKGVRDNRESICNRNPDTWFYWIFDSIPDEDVFRVMNYIINQRNLFKFDIIIFNMEKQQIQKRLETTVKQINFLNQQIFDAKEQKSDINPRVYNAMIEGYESQKEDLQAEAEGYRVQLKG